MILILPRQPDYEKSLYFSCYTSLVSSIYSAGSFSHLRCHICSCKNVYLFICRVYYSSIIVLVYSSVCLFVIVLRFPIESSIISIRIASIGGGRNYCHTLDFVLQSVETGDCVDCDLVVKALWQCQPPGALSCTSLCPRSYIYHCFLMADVTTAAPSFSDVCVECIRLL